MIKRFLTVMIMMLLLASFSVSAEDKFRIVTTTSDMQNLVQAVAGTLADVTAIASPAQDQEEFQPRPTDILRLKNAKMVVRVGLDYDLWLDRLLQEAGNPDLLPGGRGYIDASKGIALLEIRSVSFGPSIGHNHGAGNPHYWLDPENARIITASILEGLLKLDVNHAQIYEKNRTVFLSRLTHEINGWTGRLARFRGVPIIAYHNSWPYFARRFRLNIIDYIEPKVDVPPSTAHLVELLTEMQTQHVRVIIKAPFEPTRTPGLLAGKTGAKVLELAPSVGVIAGKDTYFSMMEYNVTQLVQAFSRAD
ncbi:hypothetical protein CAP31_06625 [Sulfuriferula sp. AH1]|uniref:metal ABC transporter substrate-binding protein n=1 Tax=Sulfuriferula sp. AH1 TaxID=1985873 RepID=UPI000B3B73A1|nr:metal ABC transporter substrate-binding protein [Sulfuriferula sp. AH1]ARU31386.1 hypothetical protein CAP31_06625 [Sulfuriferula sp. AH1]